MRGTIWSSLPWHDLLNCPLPAALAREGEEGRRGFRRQGEVQGSGGRGRYRVQEAGFRVQELPRRRDLAS
jgi:hypothetical protein